MAWHDGRTSYRLILPTAWWIRFGNFKHFNCLPGSKNILYTDPLYSLVRLRGNELKAISFEPLPIPRKRTGILLFIFQKNCTGFWASINLHRWSFIDYRSWWRHHLERHSSQDHQGCDNQSSRISRPKLPQQRFEGTER